MVASRQRTRFVGAVQKRKVIGVFCGPRRDRFRAPKRAFPAFNVRGGQRCEDVELRLVDSVSGAVEIWRERRVWFASSCGRPGVWKAVSGVLLRVESVDGRTRWFR